MISHCFVILQFAIIGLLTFQQKILSSHHARSRLPCQFYKSFITRNVACPIFRRATKSEHARRIMQQDFATAASITLAYYYMLVASYYS